MYRGVDAMYLLEVKILLKHPEDVNFYWQYFCNPMFYSFALSHELELCISYVDKAYPTITSDAYTMYQLAGSLDTLILITHDTVLFIKSECTRWIWPISTTPSKNMNLTPRLSRVRVCLRL
jgi:hypothetical protein